MYGRVADALPVSVELRFKGRVAPMTKRAGDHTFIEHPSLSPLPIFDDKLGYSRDLAVTLGTQSFDKLGKMFDVSSRFKRRSVIISFSRSLPCSFFGEMQDGSSKRGFRKRWVINARAGGVRRGVVP